MFKFRSCRPVYQDRSFECQLMLPRDWVLPIIPATWCLAHDVIARYSLGLWPHAQVTTVLATKKVLNLITVVLQHRHVSYLTFKSRSCDLGLLTSQWGESMVALGQSDYEEWTVWFAQFSGEAKISCFINNDICCYELSCLTVTSLVPFT